MKTMQKQNKIHNFLLYVESEEDKKLKDYYFKRKQIEENVKNQSMERIKKGREMAKKYEDLFLKNIENKNNLNKSARNREIEMMKRRIDYNNRVDQQRRIEFENDKLRRMQIDNIKENENRKRNERLERQREYDAWLRMEEMEEREKKIEEFRKQKEINERKKREIYKKNNQEKNEIVSKFEYLMQQGKRINPEVIRQSFPGDTELYKRIKNLYEEYFPNN
jgi:hypothetical protein